MKYCDGCGVTHTTIMCFNKPRRPVRQMSVKNRHRTQMVKQLWHDLNPPDSTGHWYCYLGIDPNCLQRLSKETLRLEHVKAKVRYPGMKYDVSNLKPACDPCNKLKGSRDLEEIPEWVAKQTEGNNAN